MNKGCCISNERKKRKIGCFNLIKTTDGTDDTFVFTITSPGKTTVTITITTANGRGEQQVCLPTGIWTITETVPRGWNPNDTVTTVPIVRGIGNADVTYHNTIAN